MTNKYQIHNKSSKLKINKFIGNWKLEIGNSSFNEDGFTLIELLVSAALIVILAGAFVGLQYLLSQNQTSAWKSYLNIEAANGSIAAMTNEIRDAQPSETGSYPLESAEDQEIIFYSDFDRDGVVERLRYTLTGTVLERGVVEPTGSPLTYDTATEKVKDITNIVRNSTDPVFYYYNADWPTDTTNNFPRKFH